MEHKTNIRQENENTFTDDSHKNNHGTKCKKPSAKSGEDSENDFYVVPVNELNRELHKTKNMEKFNGQTGLVSEIQIKKKKKKSTQNSKGLPNDVRVPYIYKPNISCGETKSVEVKTKKSKPKSTNKIVKNTERTKDNSSKGKMNIPAVKRISSILNKSSKEGLCLKCSCDDTEQDVDSSTPSHTFLPDAHLSTVNEQPNIVINRNFEEDTVFTVITSHENETQLADYKDVFTFSGSDKIKTCTKRYFNDIVEVVKTVQLKTTRLTKEPKETSNVKDKTLNITRDEGPKCLHVKDNDGVGCCQEFNKIASNNIMSTVNNGDLCSNYSKDNSKLLNLSENGTAVNTCKLNKLTTHKHTNDTNDGNIEEVPVVLGENVNKDDDGDQETLCSNGRVNSDIATSEFGSYFHKYFKKEMLKISPETDSSFGDCLEHFNLNELLNVFVETENQLLNTPILTKEKCDENKNIIKTCDSEDCPSDISAKADYNDTDNDSITSISQQEECDDEWEDISNDSSDLNEDDMASKKHKTKSSIGSVKKEDNLKLKSPKSSKVKTDHKDSPNEEAKLVNDTLKSQNVCEAQNEMPKQELDPREETPSCQASELWSEVSTEPIDTSVTNEYLYIRYLAEFRKKHPEIIFLNNRVPSVGSGMVATCYTGNSIGEDLILSEKSLLTYLFRYQITGSYELAYCYVITLGRFMARKLPVNMDEIVVIAFAEVLVTAEFRNFVSSQYAQSEFVNAAHALMSDEGKEYGFPGQEEFQVYMELFQASNPDVVLKSPFDHDNYNDIEALFNYVIFVATTKSYCPYTQCDLRFMCVALVDREGYVPDTLMLQLLEDLNNQGYIVQITSRQIGVYYQRYGHSTMMSTVMKKLEYLKSLDSSNYANLSEVFSEIPNTNLTCFMAIGRAIRFFNDFPWGNLMLLSKKEWHNFTFAVITLNGIVSILNPCQYISNYNNYPHLAYASKQILTKVGNETALDFYPGWADLNVKHKEEIDEMVNQYREYKVAETGVDAPHHKKLNLREQREKDFLVNLINGYIYKNVLDPMDFDCDYISFRPSSPDCEDKERHWYQLLRSRLLLKLQDYACPRKTHP